MVDGPTKVVDHDKTSTNQALIQGFVQDVLIDGKGDKLTDYVSTEQYDQHNPLVGDGLDGLGKALQAFAEAGKPMKYTKCHNMVVEGNFVFTMSEVLWDQFQLRSSIFSALLVVRSLSTGMLWRIFRKRWPRQRQILSFLK